MTEPLDFTNVGRNKANPPTQQRATRAPQRKSTNLDPWWKSKKVIVPVALVAILIAVVLFVRSRDDTGSKVSAADTATYCQLSLQVELLGSSTGAASTSATGAFDGPTPAIAEFVKQSRPIVSQMESIASSEVRSDLKTVFAAVEKAAAGDRSGVDSPSFATAQQRLVADRGATCPAGVESGEA